jgi:hypothetical protein
MDPERPLITRQPSLARLGSRASQASHKRAAHRCNLYTAAHPEIGKPSNLRLSPECLSEQHTKDKRFGRQLRSDITLQRRVRYPHLSLTLTPTPRRRQMGEAWACAFSWANDGTTPAALEDRLRACAADVFGFRLGEFACPQCGGAARFAVPDSTTRRRQRTHSTLSLQ